MELHLAPLENVSCWAFRKVCAGATDTYTGMLSLNNLIKRNNTWKEVDTYPIAGQRQWIQIATSKETECAEFLRKLDEELKRFPEKDNVYGIQLNCSCPSPQLLRIGQGPALIKRATKVTNLVRELLKQNKWKVSVKVRLGLNLMEVQQRKIHTLLSSLATIDNPNFHGVSIHFKHAQQKSADPYDYSSLKELLSYNVPIIINGGINNAIDYVKITRGVDAKNIRGLMVGRAAIEHPDAIAAIARELYGTAFEERELTEIRRQFYENCSLHAPQPAYLEKIKKYCKWAQEL
ncbi:tRNA-dihydrouridine synthase [Candidatus Woesearchaeota archaeon]|nr:tRNA-dihydrouridine synthase [Candidatus Woesearchaeota archaeon]